MQLKNKKNKTFYYKFYQFKIRHAYAVYTFDTAICIINELVDRIYGVQVLVTEKENCKFKILLDEKKFNQQQLLNYFCSK